MMVRSARCEPRLSGALKTRVASTVAEKAADHGQRRAMISGTAMSRLRAIGVIWVCAGTPGGSARVASSAPASASRTTRAMRQPRPERSRRVTRSSGSICGTCTLALSSLVA